MCKSEQSVLTIRHGAARCAGASCDMSNATVNVSSAWLLLMRSRRQRKYARFVSTSKNTKMNTSECGCGCERQDQSPAPCYWYLRENNRVRFHRIRDFKRYYFSSIPPASHNRHRERAQGNPSRTALPRLAQDTGGPRYFHIRIYICVTILIVLYVYINNVLYRKIKYYSGNHLY